MLRSPHRLAGVVGLAVLAEHHLRLVLQGLHMLRILQAARFWREAAAVSFPPRLHTHLTISQSLGGGTQPCSPPLLLAGKKSTHIQVYEG